jgi:hypothetical protein
VGTVPFVSGSREQDGAFVSLAHAAQLCASVRHWLVVGGHMVNLHIVHSGLDLPLRPTHDADIAVRLRTIRQGDLLTRLVALGYRNPVYSNRFDREADGLATSIDLLVGSYLTTHQPNMDGDMINIDGMPAVNEALARDPIHLDVVADLTDGSRLEAAVRIPDVVCAIAMKSFAVAERSNPHDAQDLGHLVEVADAAGLDGHMWPKGKAFAAARHQLAAQFVAPGLALEHAAAEESRRARLREIARKLVDAQR